VHYQPSFNLHVSCFILSAVVGSSAVNSAFLLTNGVFWWGILYMLHYNFLSIVGGSFPSNIFIYRMCRSNALPLRWCSPIFSTPVLIFEVACSNILSLFNKFSVVDSCLCCNLPVRTPFEK
jgi:hypothetical protein